MESSTAEAMRKLQEKTSDLEAKLGKKEAAIATHMNEKEALETALETAEQQRQEAELERKKAEEKCASVADQLETMTAKFQKKSRDYDFLAEKHVEAQRNRFGRKSERFVDEENPQVPLFPVEFDGNDPAPKPEDIETVTYKRKKGGQRRSLDTSGFPHREVILPVDEKDRVCSCCGRDKKLVGYHCSSRIPIIPA